MAFIDTLLRACAADGIKVWIEEPRRYDPRRRTIATVDGEDLAVRLMEHRRQRLHKPTADEKAATRRSSNFGPPKWDLQPSGSFSMLIQDAKGGWRSSKWTDGRRGRLDQKLPKIIRGLHDLAADIKQERMRREQERLAELERQRLAALERECLRKEQDFRDALLAEAEDWRRSRLLRRYVREVRNHALTHCGPVQNERLESWVERALGVANALDPMLRIELT